MNRLEQRFCRILTSVLLTAAFLPSLVISQDDSTGKELLAGGDVSIIIELREYIAALPNLISCSHTFNNRRHTSQEKKEC